MANIHLTRTSWNQERPHTLVIACSDGRLQENLDDFLEHGLGITHYDRLYAPGGGGALVSSGVELLRPDQYRRECRFLLAAHGIQDLYLIFHGPAEDGPEEAVCGDYRRKLPRATLAGLRQRQAQDADELKGVDWGTAVRVHTYRCEVTGDDRIQFVEL
ncbi:hypothetical protein GPROT1_00763 [Gammaproteobacteria bacterium]|nr:hypothetical protein GPROT1_00763 [Gammaproteobacteria bacterium]